MSYSRSFWVVLDDPTDRAATIAAARRTATILRGTRCTLRTDEIEALEDALRASPRPLRVEVWPHDRAVPAFVLRGEVTRAELSYSAGPVRIAIAYERDASGELISTLAVRADSPDERPIRAALAPLHALGVLAADLDAIAPARELTVPVYSEAFVLVVPELAALDTGEYAVGLEIAAPPERAAELAAFVRAHPYREVTIELTDDDPLLDALAHPAAVAVVDWELERGEWIRGRRYEGDPYHRDDGTLHHVRLHLAESGDAVEIETVLDHIMIEDAIAWFRGRGLAVTSPQQRDA